MHANNIISLGKALNIMMYIGANFIMMSFFEILKMCPKHFL